MTWDEGRHPRNSDGEFAQTAGSWAKKAAAQVASRRLHDEHGRRIPDAKLKGFIRVGDHPGGYGRVGGADPGRDPLPQSTHPDAGGVWIDPADTSVGRRRYVNDSGWMKVAGFAPKARSREHKEGVQSRRREDRSGSYDRYDTLSPEHLAQAKRTQARARQEQARTPRRRTPRGTRVEGWMGTVSERIGQRGNGRGQA